MFKYEIQNELENHIIPFWNSLCDNEKGGFYGEVNGEALTPDKNAPKGVMYLCHILWFYSNCYNILKKRDCLEKADHCFDFLNKYALDKEKGGVYQTLNADGTVSNPAKHTCFQAAFICAMSSYYDFSGSKAALNLAMEAFNTVETKCFDGAVYIESQSKDFTPAEEELKADTLIALIEAYTELYRVTHDDKVLERLKFLIGLICSRAYDQENAKFFTIFNKNMEPVGSLHSYGLDIEATWVLDKACGLIKDAVLTEKVTAINKTIVENTARTAFESGALNNLTDNGKTDKTRLWWVQAEGIVGFYNGWQHYGDKKYKLLSDALWLYTKNNISDPRQGGEWYYSLTDAGTPDLTHPEASPLKSPYHNGRMCLEIIKRAED